MPLTPEQKAELEQMRKETPAPAKFGAAQRDELARMRAEEKAKKANETSPIEMTVRHNPRGGYSIVPANPWETAAAGAGARTVRFFRGAENIGQELINKSPVGIAVEHFTGEPWMDVEGISDEDLREQDRLDAPLMATDEGQLGGLGGEVGLGILGGTGSKVVSPIRSAIEGAVQSAAQADPDKQALGAAVGGTIGGLLTLGMKGGRRAATGVVDETKEARDLAAELEKSGQDSFIPLALAIDREAGGINRPMSFLFRRPLASAPMTGDMLAGQRQDLSEGISRMLTKKPDVTNTLTDDLLDSPKMASQITGKRADDAIHDAVGKTRFGVKNVETMVNDYITAARPDISPKAREAVMKKVMGVFNEYKTTQGSVKGRNLAEAYRKIRGFKGRDDAESAAYEAALRVFDDIEAKPVVNKRGQPKLAGRMAQAADASRAVAESRAIGRSSSANQKQLNPRVVASRAAEEGADDLAAVANNAADVAQGSKVANPRGGGFGLRNTLGLGAMFAANKFGFGIPAAVTAGAGYGLQSKVGQKALAGRYGAQQWLANALRKNPKTKAQVERALRTATVEELDDQETPQWPNQ